MIETFENKCLECSFFKKYLLIFFLAFLILSSVFAINLYFTLDAYSKFITYQVKSNIYEYKELDLESICRISDCGYIIFEKEKFLIDDEMGILKEIKIEEIKMYPLFSHYFLTIDLEILLKIEGYNIFLNLYSSDYLTSVRQNYLVTFGLSYTLIFILMFITYKRQKNEFLLETIGMEAMISNQTMVLITENIHHELNTPLEVIENKIKKIEKAVLKPNIDIEEIKKDFEFIHLGLDQVYCIVDKTKDHKSLKYSNGNKTLYDIAIGACKVLTISNSTFDFEVDNKLHNFTLSHEISDLSNIDLLNIIINHLKNSIEANCTKILINFHSYNNNNKLELLIIDDGNGIPKKIQQEIFKPNFSTKENGNIIRGNGMYLNKFLLNSYGGEVKLIDSNSNGTIFSLAVLSKLKE